MCMARMFCSEEWLIFMRFQIIWIRYLNIFIENTVLLKVTQSIKYIYVNQNVSGYLDYVFLCFCLDLTKSGIEKGGILFILIPKQLMICFLTILAINIII